MHIMAKHKHMTSADVAVMIAQHRARKEEVNAVTAKV